MNNPTVLITGGAGYIGSNLCWELINSDYNVIVVDKYKPQSLYNGKISFYKIDIATDWGTNELDKVFMKNNIRCVIHLAGLKSVNESVDDPLNYYQNNLGVTLNLLDVMMRNSCNKLIFSSSATVYGDPHHLPITEDHPISPVNPYGHTKAMTERILMDICKSNPKMTVISLRYFNPVGGESLTNNCNNNLAFAIINAIENETPLNVFGVDYTPDLSISTSTVQDGSCIRDFISISDLINGHKLALDKTNSLNGYHVYNLGTGKGISVMRLVDCINDQLKGRGKDPIKLIMADRRVGDTYASFACIDRARVDLGYKPQDDTVEKISSIILLNIWD